MKKKVIAFTLLAMLLGGGATYAATSNYYADLVTNQKEQLEGILKASHAEREKEIGQEVHHDMVMYASTQRDELLQRMQVYLKENMAGEQQERMNMHSKEIDKAVEQLEKELKAYIDSLANN
ncbi:hypothetical protein QGM71_18130 [Virgibacillus sp. C22-A2]|uniref:Uncharacterized protein n=1 Tax=Virgibacillus tibetensis TaxID=3042313 RepID=A0ABU6KJU6_9BACI|nr:hypothetical protein [Virgibacillus sp. C22-A2]